MQKKKNVEFITFVWSLKETTCAKSQSQHCFIFNFSSFVSEHKSNCSDDQHADHHAAFRDQEDSFSDTHKETPPHSQVCESSAPQPELQTPAPLPPPPPVPAPPPAPAPAPTPPAPAEEMREDPCSSPSSATAPPLLQQTVGKVHKKNKVSNHLGNEFKGCCFIRPVV